VERTADAPHCPSCWNPTTQRITSSNCTLCLGTGRERPYFDPIPFYPDYNPTNDIVQIATIGEMQSNLKVCWSSAYPYLKPGDLIYQVMPATLWRIEKIKRIQPQGSTLQHINTIQALDYTNVEYRRLVEMIDQNTLFTVVREWEMTKAEREF
jgi:hypothetical protein